MRRVRGALTAHTEVAAQEPLRILAEGASAAALAAFTLDTGGVAPIACELGRKLPVSGFERVGIEHIHHNTNYFIGEAWRASAMAEIRPSMQAVNRRCGALLLSSVVLGANAGCGAPTPPATTAPPRAAETPASASAPPSATLFPDSGFQRFALARFSLTFELPDGATWRKAPGPGWARFLHAQSGSRLELNLTRAERLVRPEDCEARARLEHPELPQPARDEALDRQRLAVPRGFLTDATLSVSDAAPGTLEGHLIAFGATVSRCFALHFVTPVSGAQAEREVARRLGLVMDRVLPSLALREIDDRVRPTPFQR